MALVLGAVAERPAENACDAEEHADVVNEVRDSGTIMGHGAGALLPADSTGDAALASRADNGDRELLLVESSRKLDLSRCAFMPLLGTSGGETPGAVVTSRAKRRSGVEGAGAELRLFPEDAGLPPGRASISSVTHSDSVAEPGEAGRPRCADLATAAPTSA